MYGATAYILKHNLDLHLLLCNATSTVCEYTIRRGVTNQTMGSELPVVSGISVP